MKLVDIKARTVSASVSVSCAALVWLATTVGALEAEPQTIALWEFNNVRSVRILDTKNAHHGAVVGQPLRSEKGIFGSAVVFEGRNSAIHVTHSADLSLVDDFTIECVLKPFDCTGYRTILWKGDRAATIDAINYYLNIVNRKLEFKAKKPDGRWVSFVTSSECVSDHRWFYVAVTFRQGAVNIYVNGVPQRLSNPPDTHAQVSRLHPNTHDLIIGVGQDTRGGAFYPYLGLVDEIRLSRGTHFDHVAERVQQFTQGRFERDIDSTRRIYKERFDRLASLQNQLSRCRNRASHAPFDELYSSSIEIEKELATTLNQIVEPKSSGNTTHPPTPVSIETFTVVCDQIEQKLSRLISTLELLQKQAAAMLTAARDSPAAIRSFDAELTRAYAQGARIKQFLDRLENLVDQAQEVGQLPFVVCAKPATLTTVSKKGLLRDLKPLTRTISISLARNEFEGFQLFVIANAKSTVSNLNIRIGDFVHSSQKTIFPKSSIEAGILRPVDNRLSIIQPDYLGDVNDIILDGVLPTEVPQEGCVPIYLRFHANDTTDPGVYRGTVDVSANGHAQQVSVTVTVRSFSLPVRSSMRVAFCFFEPPYAKWFGYKRITDDQRRSIYDYLLKYRITPSNPFSPATVPDPKLLAEFKDKGARFCTLSYPPEKLRTQDEAARYVKRVKAAFEQVKQSGFDLNDVFLYSFDELGINESHQDSARLVTRLLRQEMRGLKMTQTSVPIEMPEDLINSFDVYIPPMELFHYVTDEYWQKRNERWWAVIGPRHPYPNVYLGYPVFDCRMTTLLPFKYKLDGILYWCINREWNDNAEVVDTKSWPGTGSWKAAYRHVHTKEWIYESGQGNLVYPGPNGAIYPSLRLENLRDGVEDYEYLKLLEKRLDQVQKKGNKRLAREIQRLLDIPKDVAVATDQYSSDPAHLEAYRQKVAQMLEVTANAGRQ